MIFLYLYFYGAWQFGWRLMQQSPDAPSLFFFAYPSFEALNMGINNDAAAGRTASAHSVLVLVDGVAALGRS